MPLITTAINSVETLCTRSKTLRTAAALGATHYRLGYWRYASDRSRQDELAEIRPKLKDLVAMNREIGICGILQNHSNGPYVGAKLTDYLDLLEGHDPRHIALAFDLGHAIKEIGEDWRSHFDRLKPWLAVGYIKDPVPGGRWAALGGGTLGDTGIFQNAQGPRLLRALLNPQRIRLGRGRRENGSIACAMPCAATPKGCAAGGARLRCGAGRSLRLSRERAGDDELESPSNRMRWFCLGSPGRFTQMREPGIPGVYRPGDRRLGVRGRARSSGPSRADEFVQGLLRSVSLDGNTE